MVCLKIKSTAYVYHAMNHVAHVKVMRQIAPIVPLVYFMITGNASKLAVLVCLISQTPFLVRIVMIIVKLVEIRQKIVSVAPIKMFYF
jgi:hypothetical protein